MAGVTAEQVQAAAEAIASEGQRPNVRNIRERLGTGSFNTLQRYLSEWRETRPQVTQAAYELPAELVNAFGAELRRGAEAATAEIRAELAEAHQEVKERAENGEELEDQIEELAQQVEALVHERDTAAAEAAAKADEIHRLTEQVQRETQAAEMARTEVATARVKIETQAEQLTTLKSEVADYHQKLDVARDRAQQGQQAAAVAESEVKAETRRADQAEQREIARAASLQSQIDELKKEIVGAREEAKAARQTTSTEADKWRETVALEHKRNAELQAERDSLAERVAVLEQQKQEHNDD